MRRPIIAANWKMNKTIPEAVDFVAGLKERLAGIEDLDVVVIPSFVSLAPVSHLLKGSSIDLGAQDVHWAESGAFTGEVSPLMLKDAGCRYVVVGHSERRHHFQETNELVRKKALAAQAHGLVPILCVGETESERDQGLTFKVLEEQVTTCLRDYTLNSPSHLVIAYEPVWAIGTGKTATGQEAEEAQAFIRNLLSSLFGEGPASLIRIQYGGSVRPDNIGDLMARPNIDGALVGGASLDLQSFVDIVMGGRSGAKGKHEVL